MKVNKYSPRLPSKNDDLFHRHVVKLLFAYKRARPDIQVCVAFLCTMVKAPIKQDYKKLEKVISYLKETVNLPLVVGADDSGKLIWNIDVLFAVHLDCINILKPV